MHESELEYAAVSICEPIVWHWRIRSADMVSQLAEGTCTPDSGEPPSAPGLSTRPPPDGFARLLGQVARTE